MSGISCGKERGNMVYLVAERGLEKTCEKREKSVDKRENLWYINLALARSKCLTRKGFQTSA